MVKQPPSPSELQLQGQLDRARAADLVERIKAAVGSAGAKAVGQSLGRIPKQSVGDVAVRRYEVWVVSNEQRSWDDSNSRGRRPRTSPQRHCGCDRCVVPQRRWRRTAFVNQYQRIMAPGLEPGLLSGKMARMSRQKGGRDR
jgi:hypothetical protein